MNEFDKRKNILSGIKSVSLISCLIRWKNGIEYLGVEPTVGLSTRWLVARARPCVAASSPLPKFTTSVYGMGGASTQRPSGAWACKPLCSLAWSNNVKNPASKCGPTPWSEDASSLGAGYLTIFPRCWRVPGWSKNSDKPLDGNPRASAIRPINSYESVSSLEK